MRNFDNLFLIALLICFFGFTSYANTNNDLNLFYWNQDTLKKHNETLKIHSAILYATSAEINGEKYTAYAKTHYSFMIKDSKGQIIYNFPKSHNEMSGFEFDDFNKDSYKDIRIRYMTNVPGIQDILLFDINRMNFVNIQGLSKFPDPQKILGTKYYYSYHRSGCADNNWDSDLFYIDNFTTFRIGNISGLGCKDSKDGKGIYISKIIGEKGTLLKTLPISTIDNYKDYKWGFIKDYWTKNYLDFEK